MAKNSIRDFDNTSGNNTDIQSVDISEGCSPAGINNAIREMMADLADVNDGTIALTSPQADSLTVTGDLTVDTNTLFVDASADAVGVNATTLDATLQVGALGSTGSNRGAVSIKTEASDATIGESAIYIEEQSGSEGYYLGVSSDGGMFFSNSGASTPTLFLGDDDNVGIGTNSPARKLTIQDSGAQMSLLSDTTGSSVLNLGDTDDDNIGRIQYNNSNNSMTFRTNTVDALIIDASQNVDVAGTVTSDGLTVGSSSSNMIELNHSTPSNVNYIGQDSSGNFRIKSDTDNLVIVTSDGNLLVGHTGSIFNNINTTSTVGSSYSVNGEIFACSDQSSGVMFLNRKTTDGVIATFRKDGATLGSIGVVSGTPFFSNANNSTGIRIYSGGFAACNASGAFTDNTQDVGASSVRWDDVYATNGTIQTSDQNEKNTITDSDLGLDFIGRLAPKSYIFNNKTRTHYGLIAQDVESVLSNIGKTTSEFAGFIKADISDDQDGSSYRYGLRYTEFVGPLIQAVKELKTKVETLETENATQATQIADLITRVTALEAN